MNALLKSAGLLLLIAMLFGLGQWHLGRTAQLREIEKLQSENATLENKNAALQDLADRLRHERRRAEIVVTDQSHDSDGRLTTDLMLVEFDRHDQPLAPKKFTVLGDEIHVRSLIVEFPDESLAENDPLRGSSLALLTGIYGQYTPPVEAVPIDIPGTVPEVYRSDDPKLAEFEQNLWQQFWKLAEDAQSRDREGVKTAYGVAPFFVSKPGQVYTLMLDPDAGLSITSREIPEPMRSAMAIDVTP